MSNQNNADSTNRDTRFAAIARAPMQVVGAPSQALGGVWSSARDIWGQREMLDLLIRRDLKARYKDSALGFLWSLIKPLTQLVIYYVVMGKFLGAARGIPDFAVYIFAGLTVYSLFSEIISSTTGSIVGNSGLIKKIYLPREIFPLASVGSALFNFLIQFSILIAATLALGTFTLSPNLLFILPSLFIVVVYGLAFGLLLSAVNVYMRDVQYLVEVGLMVLLWASPIVYSWSMVSDQVGNTILLDIYTNNPVTLAVLGFQRALWSGGTDSANSPENLLLRLAIAGIIGIIFVLAFHRVFARLQGNFAQAL
ncbi:ABC transporter permease [Cryobacterium sp. Y29]|uniref:ABC transporter permease n=1 Tax=Cryobacterium sp. Y29 TaxID=2048285 RepID=UPI000CE38DA3|nr:ABC transporter permease [Cryobacterium sp. Y29]